MTNQPILTANLNTVLLGHGITFLQRLSGTRLCTRASRHRFRSDKRPAFLDRVSSYWRPLMATFEYRWVLNGLDP